MLSDFTYVVRITTPLHFPSFLTNCDQHDYSTCILSHILCLSISVLAAVSEYIRCKNQYYVKLNNVQFLNTVLEQLYLTKYYSEEIIFDFFEIN